MSRLIDADDRIEFIKNAYCPECDNYNGVRCRACPINDMIEAIDDAPTVDQWHYPSKGEDIYNADLDWGITYFLCQMKDGKLAIAFGSCDEDCEGNVSRYIDFCGENFDVLDTDDIYAWQYIIPPKEEA